MRYISLNYACYSEVVRAVYLGCVKQSFEIRSCQDCACSVALGLVLRCCQAVPVQVSTGPVLLLVPHPQQSEQEMRSYIVCFTHFGWLKQHRGMRWNMADTALGQGEQDLWLSELQFHFSSITRPVPLMYSSLKTTLWSKTFNSFLCRISHMCNVLPCRWGTSFHITWFFFSSVNYRKLKHNSHLKFKSTVIVHKFFQILIFA